MELQDYVKFKNGEYEKPVLVSSLFREVGSTQFVPYHLVLKWGSQYHRYKKYLLDREDILSGCSTNNVTKNIDTSDFFNFGNTDSNFTGFTFREAIEYCFKGSKISFRPGSFCRRWMVLRKELARKDPLIL